MKVLRIHLAPRKRDRVWVHMEGQEEPLEIALDVMERSDVHVGTELQPTDLARLREDDTKWSIRQAAFHFLSYRPRTEKELRSKLRSKDFPPALIDWCIHQLLDQGFLDDAAFSAAFARSRIRIRPRGRRRIMQELRQKGVQNDIADQAISDAFINEDTSEVALATETATKWVERQNSAMTQALASKDFTPERAKGRRRLHAFLSRRGFTPEAVNTALSVALDRAAELCEGDSG